MPQRTTRTRRGGRGGHLNKMMTGEKRNLATLGFLSLQHRPYAVRGMMTSHTQRPLHPTRASRDRRKNFGLKLRATSAIMLTPSIPIGLLHLQMLALPFQPDLEAISEGTGEEHRDVLVD